MNNLVLLVGALATVISIITAALYVSLADLSKGVLEELSSRRPPKTIARVRRILDDPAGHARAIALPRLLSNLALLTSVVWWIQGPSSGGLNLFQGILAAAGAAVALWMLLVVIPISIASHAGERLVLACSTLVRAIYIVEGPFWPVVRALDEVVRSIARAHKPRAGEAIEAELLSVIDEGEREGQFDEAERAMIESVVGFKSTTVEQIMTPRTEIEALEFTNDLGATTALIRRVGHSRIPVYDGNLDHIVGVFYVKDLMKWLAGDSAHHRTPGEGGHAAAGEPSAKRPGFDLRSILRPAIFVPETKTVRELLRELIEKKVHIAMVADEFGGTAGLVTIEDIVEEVFGEIQDEYEFAVDEAARVDINVEDRIADIDARTHVHDVNHALQPLGVALPEADEYDTLGGFVITTLGRIPSEGESFEHAGVHLNVLEASPTRVLKVRLEVKPRQEAATEPGDIAKPLTSVPAERAPGASAAAEPNSAR